MQARAKKPSPAAEVQHAYRTSHAAARHSPQWIVRGCSAENVNFTTVNQYRFCDVGFLLFVHTAVTPVLSYRITPVTSSVCACFILVIMSSVVCLKLTALLCRLPACIAAKGWFALMRLCLAIQYGS